MSLIPAAYRQDGPSDDPVGSSVLGCRLERLLGRGGMGAAYLARRESDGSPVVVKLLAPEVASDPHLLARFEREAASLTKLPQHPHLVETIGSVGGPRPAIVMEHVEGVSLFALLRARGGRLPATEAVAIVRQVALGLSAAHAQGLVHRDLSPANVIVSPAGSAKVIDFGIAKDLHRSTLTQTGQVLGTITYMAPEQLDGRRPDARCDVFALGSTLYQLLVGVAPFAAPEPAGVAERISLGEFEPPRARVPGISPDLERVLFQMLEPELRFRYGSMREVADDLAHVLAGRSTSCPRLEAEAGARPLLPGRRFAIGVDPSCSIQLVDPSVAPFHAQIRRQAKGWAVFDLRSEHGTYVGEERVQAPRQLTDGDVVRFGRVRLRFRDPRA